LPLPLNDKNLFQLQGEGWGFGPCIANFDLTTLNDKSYICLIKGRISHAGVRI